jgi:hypothetical protein
MTAPMEAVSGLAGPSPDRRGADAGLAFEVGFSNDFSGARGGTGGALPGVVRLLAALLVLAGLTPAARAQDQVLLAEVLPVLEGTELGLLPVGDAPPPGRARVVRRSEVRRALRAAGRSSEGLVIPNRTRIERRARTMVTAELEEHARREIGEVIAPCSVTTVRIPHAIEVAEGPTTLRAEAQAPRRSGSVGAVLVIEAGGRERRLPVRATVTCPDPVVSAGSQVRIVVRVGRVRATAPGEARQAGRPGDVIRVRNAATRSSIEARVIDADTVEVVR